MSMESILAATLGPLAGDRVFPDVGPENVGLPYITYQQVGGDPVNFLGGDAPSQRNSRVQINVWGATRQTVAELARAVEAAVRSTPGLRPTVLTSGIATFEPDTRLYGSLQDFSFWTE